MTLPSDEEQAEELDPALFDRLAVFVVSGRPRSGKTTVCEMAADYLGVAPIKSSVMVNPRVETNLGLPEGTVERARAANAEAYRQNLIDEANAMAAAGRPPGLLCVEAGFRVIDGMRRVAEVNISRAAARKQGLLPIVLFVENPQNDIRANDNTESLGLHNMADAIIRNDDGLDVLRARTIKALVRVARHKSQTREFPPA